MIEFFIGLILGLLGLFLMIIIADRYWGTQILGEIVPQRPTLIYVGKVWWMERVILFFIVGLLETLIMLTVTWLLMSYAMDKLVIPLVTLWAIVLFSAAISTISRDKNGKVKTKENE